MITQDELKSFGFIYSHQSILADVWTIDNVKLFCHPGGHLLDPEECNPDGNYDDVLLDKGYCHTAKELKAFLTTRSNVT